MKWINHVSAKGLQSETARREDGRFIGRVVERKTGKVLWETSDSYSQQVSARGNADAAFYRIVGVSV